MARIKIAIAHHKPGHFFLNDVFFPIEIGASLHKEHFGITQDNTGDNISSLNAYCSEMSATYWLWKNVGADYYGLFHYRRFLSFRQPSIKRLLREFTLYYISKLLAPIIKDSRYSTDAVVNLEVDDVDKYLDSFTTELNEFIEVNSPRCIAVKPSKTSTRSNRTKISYTVGQFHVNTIENIIERYYPEYKDSFNNCMSSSKYSPFNIFIMDKELMDKYCSFIFGVLEKYHAWCELDLNTPIRNSMVRISGYIAEMLTDTFIREIEHKGIKVYKLNCASVNIQGTGLSSKSESVLSRIKKIIFH